MSEIIEILQQPLDKPSFMCGIIAGLMFGIVFGMYIPILKESNND